MKKFLAVLVLLLVPGLALGVTLEPGEDFQCGNNTYTCRNQTCPELKCTYDNCTKYIQEEMNETYSACLEIKEIYNKSNNQNMTKIVDELAECQEKKYSLKTNLTDIRRDQESVSRKITRLEQEKEKAQNDQMLYGLAGAVIVFVAMYIIKPDILQKKASPGTTRTEDGFEPTEMD